MRRANIAIVLFLTATLTGAAASLVRSRLVVPGDAMSTATNILNHEPLSQMLFAADLISVACFVTMTLLFYALFKTTNRRLSLFTASFSLISGIAVAFGLLSHIAAFLILKGADALHILAAQVLPVFALMCLDLQARLYSISLTFSGLYCVLIGCLMAIGTLGRTHLVEESHNV